MYIVLFPVSSTNCKLTNLALFRLIRVNVYAPVSVNSTPVSLYITQVSLNITQVSQNITQVSLNNTQVSLFTDSY